jgi:hypothetical protein
MSIPCFPANYRPSNSPAVVCGTSCPRDLSRPATTADSATRSGSPTSNAAANCRALPTTNHQAVTNHNSPPIQPFRFRDDPSKGIAILIEAQTGDVGDSFESHCRSTSNRGEIPAWHVAGKPVGGRDGCRNHDGPSCYIAIFDRPSLAIAQVPAQSPSEKPFGSEDGR